MTDNIKLPPFPEGMCSRDDIEDYARAAVLADRASRAAQAESVLRQFLTGDGFIAECDIPHIVAALAAQPAASASKEAQETAPQPAAQVNAQEIEAAMLRDVLKEAAQICKDLDDEALAKEDRLACGAECAAAIEYLAVRLNVAGPAASQPDKQHPDDAAVDAFAAAMKAKLAKKRSEGRCGWQECSAEYLSDLLRSHVEKGDPVDVANLAMMLHQNGQGITPAEPVEVPSDDMQLDAVKSTAAIAWGWLWHVTTADDRVNTARHLLGEMLDKDLKRYGIQTAKAEGAQVNAQEIEATMLRGEFGDPLER